MLNHAIRNILRFLVLVVLQVAIFNRVQLTTYELVPLVYVLYILLLPFETAKWLLIIGSFLLGIFVDIFSDTNGLHAAASVFMAFLRPFVLQLWAPRDGYDSGTYPRIFYYGLEWFLRYSLILIFFHHFMFFILEAFRMEVFGITLIRTLLSTVYTMVVVVLSQYLVYEKV